MKTRFDNKCWITGCGEVLQIKDMETEHILNCLKMFIQKPDRTIAMLVRDIENQHDVCPFQPWGSDLNDVVNKSINNVTSMTKSELINYALNSILGMTMKEELKNRGVNVTNYMDVVNDISNYCPF